MSTTPDIKSLELQAAEAIESGDPADAQRFSQASGMQPGDFQAQLQAQGGEQLALAVQAHLDQQGNVPGATEQLSVQLVGSDHGYDDYDIQGCEIHRVTIPHGIKRNEMFNVYGPGSSKRGGTWQGSVEKSIERFLREHAATAGVAIDGKVVNSGMTTDEFYSTLSAMDRPVFDQSLGGFVIHAHPEIGVYPRSYEHCVHAFARSKGVALVDDEHVPPKDQGIVQSSHAGIATQMHEYGFDVMLKAAIRVKASSPDQAIAMLHSILDSADCNAGAWPNGDPVLFEASTAPDTAPVLYSIDGEDVAKVKVDSPSPGM